MYIVLEGIDGVGKSSQIELLNQHFQKKGYQTKKIVEPTDSEIGKIIRKQLQNPDSTNTINQEILALLFAADRLTIKKEIQNAKKSNKIILLSDRSYYSSICYQNNSNIEKEWIYDVNMKTPRPDLTILLDLDEKESIKRCDKEEVFENTEFLKQTRKNYLEIAEKEDNFVVIDAKGSIEKVFQEILRVINTKIED